MPKKKEEYSDDEFIDDEEEDVPKKKPAAKGPKGPPRKKKAAGGVAPDRAFSWLCFGQAGVWALQAALLTPTGPADSPGDEPKPKKPKAKPVTETFTAPDGYTIRPPSLIYKCAVDPALTGLVVLQRMGQYIRQHT